MVKNFVDYVSALLILLVTVSIAGSSCQPSCLRRFRRGDLKFMLIFDVAKNCHVMVITVINKS